MGIESFWQGELIILHKTHDHICMVEILPGTLGSYFKID